MDGAALAACKAGPIYVPSLGSIRGSMAMMDVPPGVLWNSTGWLPACWSDVMVCSRNDMFTLHARWPLPREMVRGWPIWRPALSKVILSDQNSV